MGQQDLFFVRQKTAYEMFGQLMSSIDDDYVKIVMHAQVQVLEQAVPDERAALENAQYQASSDPLDSSGFQRALAAGPAPGEEVVFASEEAAAAVRGGGGA